MFQMKTLLRLAEALEDESKCAKHKVAAVIADGTRILSTGVNGTPAGETNCNMLFNEYTVHREPERTQHREWALKHETHAEINAINRMADFVLEPTNNLIAVVTRTPCDTCAKRLLELGVKHVAVLVDNQFSKTEIIVSELFHEAGIPVTAWTRDPYESRYRLMYGIFKRTYMWFNYDIEITHYGVDYWGISEGQLAYVYYSDSDVFEHEEM